MLISLIVDYQLIDCESLQLYSAAKQYSSLFKPTTFTSLTIFTKVQPGSSSHLNQTLHEEALEQNAAWLQCDDVLIRAVEAPREAGVDEASLHVTHRFYIQLTSADDQ